MTEMVNELRKTDLRNSNAGRQEYIDSRNGLLHRLLRGPQARVQFVDSHTSKTVAFQIQSLRGKEGWSQPKLAEVMGTNQNAIYRLENPNYGKATITTLKKVAAAFDLALMVRFVPFSQLLDWVSGTPYLDPGLTPNTLDVPSFQSELERGAFQEPCVQQSTSMHFEPALAKKISGEDKFQGEKKLDVPAELLGEGKQRGELIHFSDPKWRSGSDATLGGITR